MPLRRGVSRFSERNGGADAWDRAYPPPTTYRGILGHGGDDSKYAEYLEYVIEKEGDIVRLLLKRSGIPRCSDPSKHYWKKVREICTRYGVLLILDEIPIAFGRTGKMFAFEHYDIEPDIVCLEKGRVRALYH